MNAVRSTVLFDCPFQGSIVSLLSSCFKGCWDGYGKDCQHCIRRAVLNETHTINDVRDWCRGNATELLVKPERVIVAKTTRVSEPFGAGSSCLGELCCE